MDHRITERQFSAAIFTALLSPMVRVLPRLPALLAGRWAWLCVWPALPALLALALLLRSLRRHMEPGEGAAALFLRVFGAAAGRVLLLLYAAWFLFYAGYVLRSGAERLASAVYPHSGPAAFILLLLAAAHLISLGKLRAAARMAVILRGALLAVLAGVFLLSLSNIEPENLVPLPLSEAGRCLTGALPVAAAGCTAGMFSFLRGYTVPARNGGKPLFSALALFTAAAALLCLTTVGAFGAGLTARLSYPFFTMVRGLSLSGTAQRFEAAVIALWVSADLIMCSLLLRCCHEAVRTVLRLPSPEREPASLWDLRGGRWLLWPETAAAGLCAFVFPSAAGAFRSWAENILPPAMILFVFGGFTLLRIVGRLRKKI